MLPLFWVAIGICFSPISLFLNRFYSRISSLVLFIESTFFCYKISDDIRTEVQRNLF